MGSPHVQPTPAPGRPGERVAGWLVHVYTAIGVVLAMAMVHYSYHGNISAVLWLFLAAMLIDGTDGFLARRFRVKQVIPELDGALLDNIVDYITYALCPMVLLWANGFLPAGLLGAVVAAVPLVASCYQFCRTDAKTDDHFFLGFPSYWNVVAFYVIVLGLAPTVTAIVLIALSVLVFVPVKYVYPSRTVTLWRTNIALSVAFLVLWAVITWQLPQPNPILIALSLAYLAYYTALSLWLTTRP